MRVLKRPIFICALLFLAGCVVKEIPQAVHEPPSPPAIAGPEEGFKLALEAYKAGETEKAAAIAQQVTQQYPNTPWSRRSLFLMGRAYISLDRASEAEAAMLRVPAEYHELADYALFFLAEYFFSKARHADAVKLYERLTDQYPKSFWIPRSSLRKSQALYESGSYAQAAEAFKEFLENNPQSEFAPEAGMGLGKALTAQGRPAEAVRAYQDVFVKYPGNSREQEVGKAIADLKAGGVEIPGLTPDERYIRARNLFRMNQYEKATLEFSRVLEAEPKHAQKADILLRSGISLYYLGRRQEAVAALERMLREHPGDQRGAEALKWLGKAYSKIGEGDRAVQAYLKIMASYPESEWADDALYLMGNVFRESNDIQKALKFYGQLAAEYPESSFADSAIWWKAWAYYTSGDFRKTEQTLQVLVNTYPKSFLVNQARYWQGRVAEKMGNGSKAAAYYRRVLARGPYTYYGHRAEERLSNMEVPVITVETGTLDSEQTNEAADGKGTGAPDPQESFESPGPPVWTEETVRTLSAQPSFRKTLELMHLAMKKEAAAELWSLQDKLPRKHGALLGLSKAFFELGDYYRSLILILRNYDRYLEGPARDTPEDFWLLAYPQGYWDSIAAYSRKYNQDPLFIAAVIREESQFQPEALSPAGARGVMQVMPSTGEQIAQTIRMPGFDRSKLFDFDSSIRIGTWYVGQLMKRFKGDPLLVAAAYNAGPEAVASWLGKNGGIIERDEFVESIPFSETRGYVKKVLRNYLEYKRIYGKAGQNAVRSPLPLGEAMGSSVVKEEGAAP